MYKIWVSTDLHLYSKENTAHHPFKTKYKLGMISDNFAKNIEENDLWLFLGDLCDPECADVNKVKAVIQSVPCYKIMCMGNHDTMDPEWYRELGFDGVYDIIRIHNVLFSHKPIQVGPDEINIHGHLHTEVMSMLGYQHINAYPGNWNDDGSPVLLEDLLRGARVQNLNIPKYELDKINKNFAQYTSIPKGESYNRIIDLTDQFSEYDTFENYIPVDETSMQDPWQPDVELDGDEPECPNPTVDDADTINEVIFPDTDSTKNWMSDDVKSHRKMEMAEDKWDDTAGVAIDEGSATIERNSISTVGKTKGSAVKIPVANTQFKSRVERLIRDYKSPINIEDIILVIHNPEDFKNEISKRDFSKIDNPDDIGGFIDNDHIVQAHIRRRKDTTTHRYTTYDMIVIHECTHSVVHAIDDIDPYFSANIDEGIAVYESGELEACIKRHSRLNRYGYPRGYHIDDAMMVSGIVKKYGYNYLIDIIKGKRELPNDPDIIDYRKKYYRHPETNLMDENGTWHIPSDWIHDPLDEVTKGIQADGSLDPKKINAGRDAKGKYVKQTIKKGEKITSMERDDKVSAADKYGLRAVGQTREESKEDDEFLRQREIEKKKEKRKKALAKGRRKRQRKAFMKKVKTFLPGVKNEEAAVDTAAVEYLDNPDMEYGPFYGTPKKHLPEDQDHLNPLSEGAYHFEMLDHVQFFDPISEAATENDKFAPVYIVLIKGNSPVGKMITGFTGAEYSHVSISFDSSLTEMYSFAGKNAANKLEALIGGFKRENIKDEFYIKNDIPYAVYLVPSTESAVKKMKKRLNYFIKNETKFTFDYLGLVKNFFKIPDDPQYTWFCSRFVADILNAGTPKDKLIDTPSLYRPEDFKYADFTQLVDKGMAKDYTPRVVDQQTKIIARASKIQKANLQEGALYSDNPWGTEILQYQLAMMDESVVDGFIQYLQSFKLRFDKDGNILITRREYDQLDSHFRASLRLIKAYEEAGNIEGVKEELYKIHYMVELINRYYLRPDARNLKQNAKDVRKDMLDLRSVMMNAFQQHVKYVAARDTKWNFQTGYNASRYGKDTFIPQKIIAQIGTTIVTTLK